MDAAPEPTHTEPPTGTPPDHALTRADRLDLDAIEAELNEIEAALAGLDGAAPA